MQAQPTVPVKAASVRQPGGLQDLTPQQWKSGIAAWLGWLFDGLDMHLYTLVAAPFVMQLLLANSPSDPLVRQYSSWIQAAFLIGWALGGGFFGRVGDLVGRSRALSLTIITYALFTGLSSFAQTWWHLMIFRFLAALGIGGEWAVGSSLLAETWPRRWGPWIAAVLQTGVNIGVLLACVAVYFMADQNPRWVFLIGILPALLVFWIRRAVPEPEEWHQAKTQAGHHQPPISDLFRGEVLPITIKIILVCSLTLTAWWAFQFWNQQHLRNLPELASWTVPHREQLVSKSFFIVISCSILGNFFAGWIASLIGYRRAISLMCLGFFSFLPGRLCNSPRLQFHDLLAGRNRPLFGCLRPVYDVLAAPVPHAVANHRSRILLQHRSCCSGFRNRILRIVFQGGRFSSRVTVCRFSCFTRGVFGLEVT